MIYRLKNKKIFFLIILSFVNNAFCQKEIDIKYLQNNFSFEELKQIQYLKKDSLNIDKTVYDKYLDILNFVSLKKVNEAIFTIYGNDNRVDIEDTYNAKAVKNSKGVGILVHHKDFRYNYSKMVNFKKLNDSSTQSKSFLYKINNNYILDTKKFKDRVNLCDSVRFREQPTLSDICTVFAISDKYLITAAHCVNNKNIKNLRVAFGYSKRKNKFITSLKRKDIYSVKIVNKGDLKNDYAILKLKRSRSMLPKERQLPVNSTSQNFNNEKVYIIGHPYGLPLKFSDDALLENIPGNYYNAKIDAHSGNSGSPIFNSNNEVIGILSKGGSIIFRRSGHCKNMYVCEENKCEGEKIYKLFLINNLLTNKTKNENN